MIQNTPIDLQSVTGFATKGSDSFKTVILSTGPESETDLAPFEVALKEAASKFQADQDGTEKGHIEVVAADLLDPVDSSQVSDENEFAAPPMVHVNDRPNSGQASTPVAPVVTKLETKGPLGPNQTAFVFSGLWQQVATETNIEAKVETLEPNLPEKYGIHQVEIPFVNAETIEPITVSPTTSVVGQPVDRQISSGQIDATKIDARRPNPSPTIASPVADRQIPANTNYATPAIATARTEQSSSVVTIDTPNMGQPTNTTKPLDPQPIDAGPIVTRPIGTQPNETLATAEHTSALRIVDDPVFGSQVSVEPVVARRVTVAQTDAIPARTDWLATAQNREVQRDSGEVPAQATRIPAVADVPLPRTNSIPDSIAGQTTVESDNNLAGRAPVDPKAVVNAFPDRAIVDPSPKVANTDATSVVANTDVASKVAIADASLELPNADVIRNPKTFSAADAHTVREPMVETVPNEERVVSTAESESSRDADLLAADSASSQDSFTPSDDPTAGLITDSLEVSLSADDGFQATLEIDVVAPDPTHGADRPKPIQPAQVSHHDIYLPEPAVRSVNENVARTSSIDRSIPEIGRLVSQRVSETLIQAVQAGGNDDPKQLLLHLHPEELGKLTVRVGLERDLIIAKIVASELATSEMLNRDKGWLMDSLQANGLDVDSFEVSYEGSTNDRALAQHDETSTSTGERDPDPANTTTETSQTIDGRGSVVNLIA